MIANPFAWLSSSFLLRDSNFFGSVSAVHQTEWNCMQIRRRKPNQLIISFRIEVADLLNWNESKNEEDAMVWNNKKKTEYMQRMEPIDAQNKTQSKKNAKSARHSDIYVLKQIIHAIVGNHKSLTTLRILENAENSNFERQTMQRIDDQKGNVVVVMCFQCCRHSFAE